MTETRRLDLAAVLTLAAIWGAWLAWGPGGSPAYLLPLALILVAVAAACAGGVLQGRPWALIALLGFVAVVPAINFRTREIGAPGLDWQNGLKLLIWLSLLVLGTTTLRSWGGLLRDRILLAFLCFGMFGVASSTYSSVPLYSAACAIGFVGYLFFASFIAARLNERVVELTLLYGLSAYFAACWIYAAAFPGAAILPPGEGQDGYRLLGLSSHPNMLAVEAACFLFVLTASIACGHVDKRLAWILALLGAATILASGSRTSALAVALSVVAVEARQRNLLSTFFAVAVACVALVGFVFGAWTTESIDDFLQSASRAGGAHEIVTLTGRTELWSFVWGKIMERPLFGYGFNSAEAVLSRDWYGNPDAGYNAHNALLQSLLTVGILGTVPFVAAFCLLFVRWLTQRRRTLASYVIPYLLIVGITEVQLASIPTLLTLVAFVSFAIEGRAALEVKTDDSYETGSGIWAGKEG